MSQQGSPWFVLKMRAFLLDLLKEYERLPSWQAAADQPIEPASDAFIPNLVATLVVEAITWWLEQGRPYSTQEMTRRCAALVSAMIKETSTWQ